LTTRATYHGAPARPGASHGCPDPPDPPGRCRHRASRRPARPARGAAPRLQPGGAGRLPVGTGGQPGRADADGGVGTRRLGHAAALGRCRRARLDRTPAAGPPRHGDSLPDHLAPLLWLPTDEEAEAEENLDELDVGRDWALGFFTAVELREMEWEQWLDDHDWIDHAFELLDRLASGEVMAEDPTAEG